MQLITVLRVLLIATESIVIVLTGHIIQRIAPSANVRLVTLVGIALNPIAIFLVCQMATSTSSPRR